MRVIVEARSRVSLAGTRAKRFDVYELEELADGTIMLRPLIAVPEAELRAREDPAVQRAVAEHSPRVAFGSAEFPET